MSKVDFSRVVAEALLNESKEALACADFLNRYMGDVNGAAVIAQAEQTKARAETYFGADVVAEVLGIGERITDAERAALA